MKTRDIISFVMMFVVLILLVMEVIQRGEEITKQEVRDAVTQAIENYELEIEYED